jgi:hypothetical protein
MNLFWLSKWPRKNARYHCDQHVVKMPLEAVQLLYTAWALLCGSLDWRLTAPLNKAGTQRGYKPTHVNHPLARWVRRSRANYLLCVEYAMTLCKEYTKRYGKTLHAERHVVWLANNIPPKLALRQMTPIPICTGKLSPKQKTPKVETMDMAVAAYRKAYIRDKMKFARYRYSNVPRWIKAKLETAI